MGVERVITKGTQRNVLWLSDRDNRLQEINANEIVRVIAWSIVSFNVVQVVLHFAPYSQ